MKTPQMMNERMNDMPNPILEYSTYKASTVVGEVAVEGFEYPNGKKVPKEGAPPARTDGPAGLYGQAGCIR